MPIPGQNGLVSISQAKEQTVTFTPIALFSLTMVDGTFRYFCTENLDITEGGFPYKGNNYMPRVMSQSLGALQSVSDTGFIQFPKVSIKLSDADKFIWTTDELPPGPGYNGAKMTITFVFWDPDTNVFSQDEMIKFVGICDPPNAAYDSISISAVNIVNLQNINLPTAQCSQTCIWSFPPDRASRILACSDPTSVYWQCHYSVDITEADFPNGPPPTYTGPRGNNDPTTGNPFTQCDYTRGTPNNTSSPAVPAAGCTLRMGNQGNPTGFNGTAFVSGQYTQLEQDLAGRRTGVFGGITFNPPYDWRGHTYVSGSLNQNINNPNDAKYSTYFPQQWGPGFCTPPVMNVEGGANQTSFEVVLFAGAFQGLLSSDPDFVNHNAFFAPGTVSTAVANAMAPVPLVVVNDFVVPFYPTSNDPAILNWQWVNDGAVFGLCNRAGFFNGQGDPYGSMVALCVTVPIEVLASNSLPSVQIIWSGASVVNYTSPAEFTLGPTNADPIWAIYDMLITYAGLDNTTVDIQSFLDADKVCNGVVTYTDLTGNTGATHTRYRMAFNISRRRSMQDIINNLLASFKGQLAQSAGIDPTTTGKLQIFIKQTLADQQPSPVYGSNYNLPYPSATADANSDENNQPILNSVGYFAYAFDETNICRQGDEGTPTTFTIEQRTIQDTPNKVGITFQDEEYQYTADTLTMVDTQKLTRDNGQIINGPLAMEGLLNYDQAQRAIQTQFAEQFRGNPRSGTTSINGVPQDDAGGTWIVNFETTFKVIHLRVGHIVAVSFADYGLALQPFRILAIQPSMDFERITIRAQWHDDDWYLDSYGQNPYPILQAQLGNKAARPPYGWLPNLQAPLSSDPMIELTDKNFQLAQLYQGAADGTAIATLAITGCLPINSFNALAKPPYARVLEADPVGPGGNIPDGYYYAALVAVDTNGNTSAPTNPVTTAMMLGSGGHGTLTIPNIYWQSNTTGYQVYAGTNPNSLSLQTSGSGTPSSITLTDYVFAGQGMPDTQFNNLEVRVTPVVHSGIMGVAITAITATTIGIDALPAVDLSGRVCSILGHINSSNPLPILDFLISSNTSNVLTVGGGAPDLTTLPISVGDVLVVRTSPDTVTDTTIGDSLFVNGVDYFAPAILIVGATNATPIVITTNIDHNYSNGDTVKVTGVTGNLAANVQTTITVISPTQFSLVGTIGSGPYNGSGQSQQQTSGLVPHTEQGNLIYIEYGTGAGQWRKVLDNTSTVYTVDNAWTIMPDSTSRFIVTKSAVVNTVDTTKAQNTDPTAQTTVLVPVENYLGQVLWVQVFTESASGQYSVITDSPGREIFIFGGPGNSTVQYDKATFNIAVSTDLITGDDICVPYLILRPGTPQTCSALLQTPCVGSDALLDIQIAKADSSYTGTIFPSSPGIDIPAGSTATLSLTSFLSGLHFDQGDLLTVNCTQVGSTQAGRGAVLIVKFKLD